MTIQKAIFFQGIWSTLQETNISHMGKRKIIFKYALSGGYVNSLEGITTCLLEVQRPWIWRPSMSMVRWSMNFICSLQYCTQCCTNWHVWLHSLKLTFSNLKQRHPKRKRIFQPSIFRGYVSFREGIFFSHLAEG